MLRHYTLQNLNVQPHNFTAKIFLCVCMQINFRDFAKHGRGGGGRAPKLWVSPQIVTEFSQFWIMGYIKWDWGVPFAPFLPLSTYENHHIQFCYQWTIILHFFSRCSRYALPARSHALIRSSYTSVGIVNDVISGTLLNAVPKV